MKASTKKCKRVIAIHPSRRGFGFAVLEGVQELIDWGAKEIRRDKNTECLRQIAVMIERYSADAIIIEDYQAKECRRSSRVKDLLVAIAELSLSKGVKLRKVSRSAVGGMFSQSGICRKHQIAIEIGKQLPELAAHVPPIRKPWLPEDARMCVFDALALGLLYFYRKRKPKDVKPNGGREIPLSFSENAQL